ncbi:MAG: alpha/beta hydrolase family protein [Gemmatimonadota bacterium]
MRLTTITILLCFVASDLPSQSVIGTWQGYWARAGDTMAVTLHIHRDSAGQYAATFDADRLRVSGIPFSSVGMQGGSGITMVLRGDRTTATFAGTLSGDSIKGTLVEDGSPEGTFAYARSRATAAPFEEREITFNNGAVRLAGSLIIPNRESRVPAVVFLHGSGPEGRWASRFLASQLATHGIAALIWDKRGVGQSRGDWRQATPADLAGDAAAAVARLRAEPRIDTTRIGIHGHSQGGTLAPMVAVQSPGVAFVIASAGAGLPMDSVEIFSVLNSILPEAKTTRDSADARAYTGELVAVAYQGRPRARLDSLVTAFQGRPWYFAPPAPDNSYWTFSREYARFRPLDWWARVRVPVLLIYGAADQRVPARASAERISATVQRNAADVDLTIRILPGADHTFRLAPGPGGWPRTAPDYVPTLLHWLGGR